MIIPSPLQIKAAMVAGAVMAIAILSLLVWGLYWRGEARSKDAQIVLFATAMKIADAAAKDCNAGVEAARASSAEAIQRGAQLLAEAKRIGQPARAQAARIEALLAKGTPAGADCRDAWRAIEADRKAGAAP